MSILYKANETDFNHLGLGPLNEATSILVTEERNGIFELEMTYPTEGSRFADLKLDRLIKSDAGHELKNQRFKIIRITKPIDGIVTVNAEHVSYLTQDLALRPTVNYSGTASQALNNWATNIVDNHPFMVASDITTTGSGSWSIKDVSNAREALGGVSGSLLETYGGEYRFDNYSIRLMAKRGINSGALIAYGRNLTDLTQEESIADTYTSVYPYAVYQDANNKEVLLTLPEYFVDSDYVGNYARRKIKTVNFSEDEIKTVAQLRSRCISYMKSNGIGIPKVNLKIKYVDLAKTLDYKDVAILEQINVCDNVTVYFEKFDVNTNAKIIKTVWNDLLKQYDSIEVGEARASLSQQINSTVDGKIETIAQQVNTIQLSADGKNVIHRGPIEPPPGNIGDMWYQPDGEFEIFHQWDGSVWKVMLNTRDLDSVKRESEQNKIDLDAEKIRIDNTIIKADQAIADAGFIKLDLIQVKQDAVNAMTEAQQATGNVNTISTKVDTLTQTMVTKADNTTVNNLTGVVDRHTLDIATNAREISLKLTSAQVESAITAKGYATTTALNATSNSLGLQITEVSTNLSNLEIGGRNLLTGTSGFTGSWGNINGWVIDAEKYESLTVRKRSGAWNGLYQSFTVEKGKKYTFSLYAKSSTAMGANFYPSGPTGTNVTNINSKLINLTTEFQRYGLAFSALDNGIVNLRIEKFNDIGTVYVAGYKLERGNKATDWSPAPEDMATVERAVAIEVNLNGLQTTVSNKAEQSQVTQIAGQIASKVEGSVYNSKMTQLDSAINFRVTAGQVNESILADKQIKDTRTTNQLPNWYYANYPKQTVEEFKQRATMGVTGTAVYGQLTTQVQWDSSTGGSMTQIFNSSDGVFQRKSNINNTWTAWEQTAEVSKIVAQINLSPKGVLIQGKNIQLDGDVAMDNAFVNRIKAIEVIADKITTGTLNGANVNLINLNASSITAGTFTGANYELNLSTGTQMFRHPTNGNTLIMNQAIIGFHNSGKSRYIEYWDEGLKIYAGSQNTGISANTGLQLIGGHSYIDFISNISGTGVQQRLEASSGNMYIIHSNTGALRVRQAGQAENTGSVIAGFFKTSHDQGAVLTMWGDTINVPNDGNRNIHLVPNGTGSVIVGTWQGTRWNIQASDFVKVSSRATKTNIIPLDNGLNTINSLLPVTYNKIDKLNRGINEVEKGFIAEDSPSVSTPDGKGIYDSFIVAHLVKGMQELDIRTANETDILKEEVRQLKIRIQKLESAA